MDKTEFEYGEDITFSFTGSTSEKDFISIYSSSTPDGTGSTNGELAYAYTVGESGTVSVANFSKTAWATTPGDYIAKYWAADQYKVLMGTLRFTIKEPEQKDIYEYYVKKGGTGDGRSVDAPAGSIVDIVKNINADGHKAGGKVTVYVIDSGEAAKTVIDSDCVIGYNNTGINQVPKHKVTIKYTSYDENVTSVIGHVNYQGSSSNASHFLLAGPSEFENINLLDMRNSSAGGTDNYMGGHPVSFKNVKFMDLDTSSKVFAPSSTHLYLGQTRGNSTVSGDQDVYLDNASIIGDFISMTGYTDAGSKQTLDGDVTLRIGSGTLKNLYLNGSGGTETVTGNMNIVLGKGVSVTSKFKGASGSVYAVVNGAVQIIKNYGAAIPAGYTAQALSVAGGNTYAPVYEITSMEDGVSIDVTETAGEFAITHNGGMVYAVTEDGTVYYDEGNILTVPAGVYGVYSAADKAEMITKLGTPAGSSDGITVFDKWADDGEKLIATFKQRDAILKDYYVMYGGTGDGKSEASPAGTIGEVIDLINNVDKLTAIDTATVHILRTSEDTREKWETVITTADGTDTIVKDEITGIGFLSYSTAKSHKAKIIYEGESAENLSSIVFASNWSWLNDKGGHMNLAGPSEFKNIRIIDPRANHYWVLYLCGNDVEFTGNSVIKQSKVSKAAVTNEDGSTTTTYTISNTFRGWAGVIYAGYHYSVPNNKLPGSTITFTPSKISNKIVLNSDVKTTVNACTATGDMTAVLGAGTLGELEISYPVSGVAYTFEKNVNVVLNGTTLTTLKNSGAASIGGALQIVLNNGAVITTDATTEENKYVITAGTGATVDVTDEAGVFAVSGGNIIYTVSDDNKTINYYTGGTFTAPAYGAYTVNVAASLDALKAAESKNVPAPEEGMEFAGWVEETAGVLTAKYQPRTPKQQTYYIKWGGTGDGLTPESPLPTLADAVAASNATGELIKGDIINVYVMNDDTHTSLEAYNEAHPEFWKYSAAGEFIFNNKNLKNVESRFTAWGRNSTYTDQHTSIPFHDATLVVTSYDKENPAYIAQHVVIGMNAYAYIGGPTVLRDITYVTARKYDRELMTRGYDCEFDNVTFLYMDSDNSQASGTKLTGLVSGHFRVFLGDKDNTLDGPGGTITVKSAVNATGGTYGLEIPGDFGATFTKHTKLYFDHASLNLGLNWGRKAATFNNGLSIVVNKGTVTAGSHTSLVNTVTVNGGLTVIANNGTIAPAIPSNVTADKQWIITVVGNNGTLDVTNTAGTFSVDTEMKYYYSFDDTFGIICGEISAEDTINLPEGVRRLYFSNTDPAANDFEVVRSVLPAKYKNALQWTKVSDTQYASVFPKIKQVMKITDAGANFESNTNNEYVSENITFQGQTVRKVTRAPEATTTKANPLFYKYSAILDEDGNKVSVSTARYISFRYYYAPASGGTAPLVGGKVIWTQGKLEGGSWNGAINASSRDAYVANKWSTITIDMWNNALYKNNAFGDAGYLAQYKFAFLNGKHLEAGDTLYISDVIFTNYDPAEELAQPVMVFVSENGDDANTGLSADYPVKTLAKAYEIAKNNAEITFDISGNVTEGTYAAYYPELTAKFVSLDGTGAIANLTTVSKVDINYDIIGDVTVDNGMEITFGEGFGGAVTVKNGLAIIDTDVSSVIVAEGATATVDIAGGNVAALTLPTAAESITIDVPTASAYGTITANGTTTENLMVVTGHSIDVPAALAGIAVSGKNITVKTPIMKASTGEAFAMTPTAFGKVKTYSGTAYNFGAGHTTYIAYTVTEDGYTAYYSNANTGYILTIGEGGVYQVDIACEKGYNHNGNASKPIAGFDPSTHLTLPEDAISWIDDGAGTITASTSASSGEYKTVYVSNRYGSDDNDGLTAKTALKTIKAAVYSIGLSNDGKVIVLDGRDSEGNPEYAVYTRYSASVNGKYVYGPDKLTIDQITQDVLFYDAPAHTGTITYEGDAADSVLCGGANHLELNGPSVFKNISYIEGYNTGKSFVTRGYPVSFEGTVYEIPNALADGSGGVANKALGAPVTNFTLDIVGRTSIKHAGVLTVGEKYTGNIAMSAWDGTYTVSGPQTIVVNGAKISSISVGSAAVTNHNILSIVLNSGSITTIKDAKTPAYTTAEAVQIICNNGTSIATNTSAVTGKLGNWYMNSAATEGCSLDVTNTAGTFKVNGGKYAKAVSGDSVVYSANGMLTVPAGTWTVTYVNLLPYEIKDDVLTANEDIEITVSELDGNISNDGVFMGWSKDAEGTSWAANENSLATGEKLYAKYENFDKSVGGDLSVLGAQIRLASDTVKQGLRFVSKADKEFLDMLGITQIGGDNVKYGAVLFPENFVGEGELVLGQTYGNYVAADVKAVNTYREDDNSVTFTAVVTGISDANLTRRYTVRPYISYTDKNGVTRTVYGDSYATSVYAVAAFALDRDTALDDTAKEVLTGIKDTAADIADAPVSIVAYKNAPESYEAATEEQFAKGEVFYKNSDGITIREIHIPGAKKETTVGILTDTHINLLNEKDKYYPEVQLTYYTRTWLRNGLTIGAFSRSADLADKYDQLVVTGDIIDYLSYGALDALDEHIFQKHPTGLYALGGHDVTRNMETGLGDKTPLAERQALLQEYWPHNIYYASRIVNDSVMCIQLDNGCTRFWPEQVDKLAADIEKARENGYIVLIFEHEPINSGDTTATEVISYDSADTNNFWFGEGRVHWGVNADEATKAVYNLITKNADVVRGVFCGHTHLSAYVDIKASYVDENGNTVETTIPQYVNRPVAYETNTGSVTKVVITAE